VLGFVLYSGLEIMIILALCLFLISLAGSLAGSGYSIYYLERLGVGRNLSVLRHSDDVVSFRL
jgi:NhaP-type Na+/H+ and K+/H+ antiporter